MTRVNPNNGTKTKSDIFHKTCSNLTSYVFLIKKIIKVFQLFSKLKFLSFMTRVNPSNGNKTKSAIFLWDIFQFDIVYFF